MNEFRVQQQNIPFLRHIKAGGNHPLHQRFCVGGWCGFQSLPGLGDGVLGPFAGLGQSDPLVSRFIEPSLVPQIKAFDLSVGGRRRGVVIEDQVIHPDNFAIDCGGEGESIGRTGTSSTACEMRQ
jgi:hypothetical protein